MPVNHRLHGKVFYDLMWRDRVLPELEKKNYNLRAVVDGLDLPTEEDEERAYQAMSRRWRAHRKREDSEVES